jgi:hypothetical protein
MRLIRAITGVVGCLALSASWAAAAPFTFQVVVNTTPLVGNAAGPFALDFQLNDGSGLSDGNNTATISGFSFTGAGAGPTGLPSSVGGATGSLSSTVSLTDSGFLNEFFQGFTAGNSLRFLVTWTSNVDAGPAPDAFSFAILDRNLLNIATTGLGDSLLLVEITRATSDWPTSAPSPARVRWASRRLRRLSLNRGRRRRSVPWSPPTHRKSPGWPGSE